jgi:DNA primase
VADHIARALPLDVRPAWTMHRPDPAAPAATWAETGHRLVFPLYDAGGTHRSVLARAIVPTPRKSSAKGRRSGLVLANGRARKMLRGHPLQPASDGERRIIIAEGEIDWLTWVAQGGETVIGIWSGSWTPELAARLPDGAVLVVRVHGDDAGRKYAQEILDSVRDRVTRGAMAVRFAPHFAVVDGRRVTLKQEAAG